jgi:hypothetical protein
LERLRAAAKHWPTGLIVSILLGMTAYLSTGRIDSLVKADSDCMAEIKSTCEKVVVMEKRLDRIETTLPYTVKAIEKNTKTLEAMAENVQEIKILMITNLKEKESINGYDRSKIRD